MKQKPESSGLLVLTGMVVLGAVLAAILVSGQGSVALPTAAIALGLTALNGMYGSGPRAFL
ncbi:MAG: hypothetical protein ABIK43_06360 [candidate division WOR-3 bacterium]